jgi:hypothetical protein
MRDGRSEKRLLGTSTFRLSWILMSARVCSVGIEHRAEFHASVPEYANILSRGNLHARFSCRMNLIRLLACFQNVIQRSGSPEEESFNQGLVSGGFPRVNWIFEMIRGD